MHPELLHIAGDISVKTYGFCLAVGFSLSIWLALRRVERFGGDQELFLRVCFLIILCGVGGARLLYVVHYWEQYSSRPNPILSALDIRQGGLEFVGGLICAATAVVIYLLFERRRVRKKPGSRTIPVFLYLDIAAPSTALGLAITRLGCFGNGCCYGDICEKPQTAESRYVWAAQFPFASPPFLHQWENRQVSAPADLILTTNLNPLPRLADRLALANVNRKSSSIQLSRLYHFPSRIDPQRKTLPEELQTLAASLHTAHVHPTQLYASINALLICFLLSAVLYVRKREGLVFVLLFLLYPPGRFILELIRTDNPIDTFGLTISQFTSISMFGFGLLALILWMKFVPLPIPQTELSTSASPQGPAAKRQISKKRHRRKKTKT